MKSRKLKKILVKNVVIATVITTGLLVVSCSKKSVGGVDMKDVDMDAISANASNIMNTTQTNPPENSGIVGIEDVLDEPKETKKPEETVSILAVGDNLYHSNVTSSGLENGKYNFDHIYAKMKDEISKADIAVVNQETIFALEGEKTSGYPAFCSPKEIADALVNAGFDVIEHATNHTADKGSKNITYTLDTWAKFPQVKVIGMNRTKEDVDVIPVVEKNGIKFAMLNYTEMTNKGLGQSASYQMNIMSESRIKDDVAKAKKIADIVIVYPHWGTEYMISATAKQKEWAKFMADLGVDVIIGAHPHVIEPVEWVQSSDGTHKTLCYYSLGNYVSRQIEGERLLGGMAKVTFSKSDEKVSIKEASVTPLMMHYERYSNKNTYVLRLDEYTDELAKQHGVVYYESLGKFSLDKVKKLATDVFGSVGENKITVE